MEAAEATPRIGQGPAPAPHKWLVALAVMLGPALEVLDTSIINVALPHLQGTFSASVDEIAWVLTSYLVANGIMIPMTGWISSRFGRKRYFLTQYSLSSAPLLYVARHNRSAKWSYSVSFKVPPVPRWSYYRKLWI